MNEQKGFGVKGPRAIPFNYDPAINIRPGTCDGDRLGDFFHHLIQFTLIRY